MAKLTPKEIATLRAVIDHHEKEQWLKEQRRLQRRIWAAWLTYGFAGMSILIEVANLVSRFVAAAGGGSTP